ncbi:MAG: hypothetical protein U0X71_05065 [Sphingobacteriaceae bacterium]|nr:MAG: hypothetical protein E6Q66_04975 [Pedobacter sp.]
MATNIVLPSTGGVKIRRANVTTNGVDAAVDSNVKSQLVALNTLLAKPVFLAKQQSPDNVKTKTGIDGMLPADLLIKQLSPRCFGTKHQDSNQWEGSDSLLENIYNISSSNNSANLQTIEEYIDATAPLSLLKYSFNTQINENLWTNFDNNTKTLLTYPAIVDYLLAYSYVIAGNTEINGLINFIFGNANGLRNILKYTQISAARQYINAEKVDVHYNSSDDLIIKAILNTNPALSSLTFGPLVHSKLEDYITNSKELSLIDGSALYNRTTIPAELIQPLIYEIKHSIIPVTKANYDSLAPIFLNDIKNNPSLMEVSSNGNGSTSDSQPASDFDVDFLDEQASTVTIAINNIRCAAQMFYSMTLGDELNIFDVMNYFTHKFMIRGTIQISDKTLREDLQLYVFSNKFTNILNGKIVDRTRPTERYMFYKQVFNYGSGQITEDVIVNKEFNKLFKILIMEGAKYIQRAQESPNPESYVSRQPIMQAVEDLQYNLSTHCSGMANVITPIIYEELNFIIKRVLNHPEIVQQLVPAGGTWWKVVELLYEGMKQQRPKTTILYNKAKLGFEIFDSIAKYNPASFEDDKNFSDFISNVDAYIITQAQLQSFDDDNDDKQPENKDKTRDRDKDSDTDSNNKTDARTDNSSKDEWAF